MPLFGPNVRKMKEERNIRGLVAVSGSYVYKAKAKKAAAAALDELRDIDGLMKALGHEPFEAAKWLARFGAVDPLIAALGHEDRYVRTAAASELGDHGDARAVEALVSALDDEESDVRFHAAYALSRFGDARGVEPLIAALREGDETEFSLAAHALGELGDRRAVRPLTDALTDERIYIRSSARDALERLDGAEEPQPAPAVQPSETRKETTRGGLGEPYCSERCYELGGQTIARELLSGWSGDCSVCRKPIRLAVGGRASMVCYRPGEFLYFCGDTSCVEAVRHALRSESCVVCGASVA